MSDPIELRPCVRRFAELMELKLRANDHKGDWQEDEAHALIERARHELKELEEAVTAEAYAFVTGRSNPAMRRAVADEAAATANFCLMVADVCRGLTEDTFEADESDHPMKGAL